jgi:hypothetical protein
MYQPDSEPNLLRQLVAHGTGGAKNEINIKNI